MTRRDRGGSRLRLPPPRQPHPHGGDSPSIHCQGSDPLLTRFQARNSPKILPPRRGTVSGPIATHCPPPLEGAGGGHVSGRAVGVFLPHTEKSVRLKRRRQGRGASPPPPSPSAPPQGGDSPSIHCQGGDLLTTFSVRYFPEIPFPSLPRLSRICHHAPPAHRMEEARLKRRFTTVVIRWRQTMIELV